MGSKKGKKGKKTKKPLSEIEYAFPQPDYATLMKVPVLNWQADIESKIVENNNKDESSNTALCSKTVKGQTPVNYSFNSIKESIEHEFADSFGNLTLYYKDDKTQENRCLKNLMNHKISDLLTPGNNTVKFTYDFDPFVHPMLEASVTNVYDKK